MSRRPIPPPSASASNGHRSGSPSWTKPGDTRRRHVATARANRFTTYE